MSERALPGSIVSRRTAPGGVPFRPGRRHPPLVRRLAAGGPERAGGSIGGSPLRAIVRVLAYLAVTLSLAPVQLVALLTSRRLAERIPQAHHRLCSRLLGFRIERRGRISRARPTLFVGNHSSYLDIIIYGALISGSFVAKSEVAGWPLFGWLARMQRTVFVDRNRRRTHHHRNDIARRLEHGDNLILFPEGTSNDGNRVLPFRSALFSVAEPGAVTLKGPEGAARSLTVQPVSIAYTRLNGFPIGHALRPCFAWYGDMGMAGHLFRALSLGRVTVVVEFHRPVTIEEFGSRKALSEHCYQVVADGVASALNNYQPRTRMFRFGRRRAKQVPTSA
jgi:1-acyl-sn-glycerol-3-phosphate acyltransferase